MSISIPFAILLTRVASCFAETIHRTHSRLAIGVISIHRAWTDGPLHALANPNPGARFAVGFERGSKRKARHRPLDRGRAMSGKPRSRVVGQRRESPFARTVADQRGLEADGGHGLKWL
jgi:hypothetical protein